MKRFFSKQRDNLIIILGLLIVFAIIYKTFGFYYGINDDISMQKLAAGTSGAGVPDGHLIFVKYALGVVLAALFKAFPGIDWYGLFMIGCIFFCGYLVLKRIYTLSQNSVNKILIRVIGIVFVLFWIVDSAILFQFTVVAGVLAATAVFCVVSSKNIKISDYILAWVLIILASLIRLKVFYMTLPIAGIITLGKYIESLKLEGNIWAKGIKQWCEQIKDKKSVLIKLIIVSVIGFSMFYTLTSVVEDAAYSKSPWNEYVEYKHARSLIMDYYGWPSYEGNEAFWNSVDISEEEHKCLKLYGILPNVDSETIIKIADYASESYYVSKEEHIANMKSVFMTAVKAKNCRTTHVMLLISIIILVAYLIKAEAYKRFMVVLGIMAELAILLYLLYGGRFPTRIIMIYDYQCILTIFGVVFSDINFEKTNEKLLYSLCLTVLSGTLIFSICSVVTKVEKQKNNLSTYTAQLEYAAEYPDYFFIVPTGTLVTTKQFTIHEQENIASNMSGTYGWSVFSPWSNKRFENYGLVHGEHIILKSNVCMFTTNILFADQLNEYYLSEGWIDEDYEIVDSRFLAPDCEVVIVKWNPASTN